jgi:nitroreductase
MDLTKAIQSRHSIKKFKEKKPDWRKIIECIDASRYAPMAGNDFNLKFILVNDNAKIQKIAEACQQQFVSHAKSIVVVCSNLSRITNTYGKKAEIYCRQQAGAGIQNFLLKIQEKGLSTCWVGDFVEEQIKRTLKIPAGVNVEAIFPIGYEFEKQKRKTKIDLDRILYFEAYGNKRMKPLKKFDV